MKIGQKVLYKEVMGDSFEGRGEIVNFVGDIISLKDEKTGEIHEGILPYNYELMEDKPFIPEPSKGVSQRFNQGKPELSYILSADYAIEGIAEVMSFGATKYERDNWKIGFPKEKLADSLLRHLTKFLNGEEIDEESGLPHVDHIACNGIFFSYHFNGRKAKAENGS